MIANQEICSFNKTKLLNRIANILDKYKYHCRILLKDEIVFAASAIFPIIGKA